MLKRVSMMAGLLVVLSASGASAATIELITNGGFETGTFAGWTVTDLAGGTGSWFIDTPGTTTPVSGNPTLAAGSSGSFYAVTDQTGPGTHVLSQLIVVPVSTSVILSFNMFANDWDAGPICGTLTHLAGPRQCATVDILSSAASVFDTGAGQLANYYLGVDAGADPHGFTTYTFDITSLVGGGGTFRLRFGEADNQFYFNMGVDNVSVRATTVPEPSTLILLGTGFLAVGRRFAKRT
jgi:PEP-CTERM motif